MTEAVRNRRRADRVRKTASSATCATCGATAPRPWGEQTPHTWASMSFKPVGPLVETCCNECTAAWLVANQETVDAWRTWHEAQFEAVSA